MVVDMLSAWPNVAIGSTARQSLCVLNLEIHSCCQCNATVTRTCTGHAHRLARSPGYGSRRMLSA
jgi:hypothetical protein